MIVSVHTNEPWGSTGKILTLGWKGHYIPGQWVGLRVSPNQEYRMYSIANPPGKEHIAILYTRVDQGVLTPILWELESGHTLELNNPQGAFVPQKGKNLWIAAGTGIAPFLSMTDLIMADWFGPPGSVTLLESNKQMADVFGLSQLSQLHQVGKLHYYPFITRNGLEDQDSSQYSLIQKGRLTLWLCNQSSEYLRSFDRIMICGSTQMILDVRDILLEKEVDFHTIVSEVYF